MFGGLRGELVVLRLSNSFLIVFLLVRKVGGWLRVFGFGLMVKGCVMFVEFCLVLVEVVGCMEYRRVVGVFVFN